VCKTCEENIFVLSLPSNQSDNIMSFIKRFIEDDPEYQAAYREWAERIAREEAEYFAQFESREEYEQVTQNPQS
jgi:hypothetical protein